MATFLYRLGRLCHRGRRLVALLWLAVLIAVGGAAATLSGPTSDSFSIPGTESQEAFDLLEERFPDMSMQGAEARVVFAAPEGSTMEDPETASVVEEVVGELRDAPQVANVDSPFDSGMVSEDGTIAMAQVSYEVDFFELEDAAREALFDAVETGRDAGLTVEAGGDATMEEEVEGGSEMIGLAVAAVVLLITFGSLAAAGMPLITGVTGVMIGISGISAATGFLELGETTPILATMLGLAVGIDYALFIVSRYRHELSVGNRVEEAVGRAIGTAGSAVVFAGLTVMIALVGLSVVGIPILTEMGLAAAVTVGIAVLVALSLLPALLGFAGNRVLRWRVPGLKISDPEADNGNGKGTLSKRYVGMITRRPLTVLVIAVAALGALALPALDLRLGLPDDGDQPPETTQRQAYDLTAEGFGPGFNGPLLVVVDGAQSSDPQATAEQVSGSLAEMDGVARAAPPQFNQAGDTAIINVIPTTGPSSQETEDLVETMRSELTTLVENDSASVAVTGNTAIMIDFSDTMGDAMLPYLMVVVGLSLILLMLVFRSIVVPVKAAAGFLLTMAATFGAIVAVFQWGWLSDVFGIDQTGPIISMLPIFIIGVVFGLAMDYEVFLVTRMREEYVRGHQRNAAITVGFQHGSRVVAAAALIMISVFFGFVLGDDDIITQVGLALAAAIAFDAFVVRMTIVPAVLALVGDRAWWLPRWLDRVLPNVDVEGTKLARYLAARDSQEPATAEPAGVGSREH
ncbi:MMPL family transporter [Actinobacteria bacterium YIM 96077]|uniref:MMPL family transporter n=1 Tax=Phytoactinopolyspora halophila TaxID=1981511 RepID=A0A329QVW4_9ACTN|nr:MMPL family transporter [Phytoactinopolyspora halophila]AYY12761.1 MMPL family transporter [Actinobacteria bacterium YIM 96077]RAW16445.1 MMPL family transporter [Phytoactinopolyspora halophila]